MFCGTVFAVIALIGMPVLRATAAKPNTVTPVALTVTVHATDSSEAPCHICSDDQGPYIDGVDGVAAHLDQYGNIIINFQTGPTPVRKLHYEYAAVDGQPIPPSDPPNNYFSTILGPGAVPLQKMGLGATECLAGGPVATLDDFDRTQYRFDFHREWGGFDFSNTSYLVATHDSPTTWQVEPKPDPCNPVDSVIRLLQTPSRAKFSFTDHGLYPARFRMTLTTMP
jgi:hypothetical protein